MPVSRLDRLARVLPLLAAATAAAVAMPASAATPVHTFHSPRTIGTTLDVMVATHDPVAAEQAFTAVQNEIARLEAMLSTRIATSSISQINATSEPVAVPAEVIELLAAYDRAAGLTNALVSPFVGELSARWSQAAKENKLPAESELQAIVGRIQQTALKIDRVASTVQRIGPALLNIDALGKPFILDRAAKIAFGTPNLAGLLVNIGGEIIALGSPAGATPWTVQVADPANPADNADPIATLNMTRRAVATSGDYARGRTIAGEFVSHILNPLTGQPAGHGLAATVMHDDPITANALSTAFCVAGPAHAADMAAQVDAQYLLSSPAGTQISAALPKAATQAPAAADASAFPKDFKVTVPVVVIAGANQAKPDRACGAIWIEDDTGKVVKVLGFWGMDKYAVGALKTYAPHAVPGTKTIATKNAGTYSLEWDGTDTDGKAVPQGKYTVQIELAYRYNGHSATSVPITCGADAAEAKVTKTGSIDASTVTYGPAPKP